MRKLLATVLLSLLALPVLAANVTYVGKQNPATGTIPFTSGSYTPTAGNQILLLPWAYANTGANFTLTGSASTPTVNQISGSNFVSGTDGTYAIWSNLSAASGAQTWTVTQPSGDSVELWQMEFSNCVSIKNTSDVLVASPGTGAGAIVGNAVTVATTDLLVVAVFTDTNVSQTAPSANSPSGSTNIQTYGAAAVFYWAGTGSSMTPTFTVATGGGSYSYMVLQMVLSNTGITSPSGILFSNGKPLLSNGHPVLSN